MKVFQRIVEVMGVIIIAVKIKKFKMKDRKVVTTSIVHIILRIKVKFLQETIKLK